MFLYTVNLFLPGLVLFFYALDYSLMLILHETFSNFLVFVLNHHPHPYGPQNHEATVRYLVNHNSDEVSDYQYVKHPELALFLIKYLFSEKENKNN